jgi:hypothetical protein
MNPFLSLTDEEINVLQDHHAGKIGQVEDSECDQAMKRIEQLERCKATAHQYHDFEAAA